MRSIFLSHSRLDSRIITIFNNTFTGTEVKPIFMEYENFVNPPWSAIKSSIESSSALFVLLSNSLRASDFTQNWVSYEVGIADEAHKEIWVFEDINNQAIFPIPKVDHYVLYDANYSESLNYLKTIIRSYALNYDAAVGLGLLSLLAFANPLVALVGAAIGSQVNIPVRPTGTSITCCYPNCRITFQYHNLLTNIRCPSCRQLLQITFQNQANNSLT